ncbi:hypothetical protein DFH07DRAFT_848207, partial [Mycena maculata]
MGSNFPWLGWLSTLLSPNVHADLHAAHSEVLHLVLLDMMVRVVRAFILHSEISANLPNRNVALPEIRPQGPEPIRSVLEPLPDTAVLEYSGVGTSILWNQFLD